MKPTLLFIVIIAIISTANAYAGDSCRAVAVPKSWDALPQKARDRFPGGDGLQPKKWSNLTVSVYISRAPHIASQILTECGDVKIASSDPADQRRFSAVVSITVTSWATLARIAQLPAVMSVSAFDRTIRIKHPLPHPHPMIDFD